MVKLITEERKWAIALIISLLAIIVSITALVTAQLQYNRAETQTQELRDRQNEIEATELLHEAWDALGGAPYTNAISDYVTDPSSLERARRAISKAEKLAPELHSGASAARLSLASARAPGRGIGRP